MKNLHYGVSATQSSSVVVKTWETETGMQRYAISINGVERETGELGMVDE